jgi:biopolymer transport protein ExbD
MKIGKVEAVDVEKFDLTAMIDIVLLLIIFFTFTAQFAAATRAPMNLPREAGEPAAQAAASAVVVDVAKDGSLRVLDAPVTLEALIPILKTELGKSVAGREPDLLIRADREGPALHLNRLAGALQQAGLRRWKLATSAEPAGQGGAP